MSADEARQRAGFADAVDEGAGGVEGGARVLVRAEGLRVGFGGRGMRRGEAVVDGVSFELRAGRALAIVGESGSGKSVTARALVGLAGAGSWVAAKTLEVGGASVLGRVDADGVARGISAAEWRRIRGRQVGLVVQDALVSLDPLRPIGREIDDALRLHTRLSPAERRARVLDLLESVGMPEPAVRRGLRSGELSGGLRQRALIASALAADPALVIADEPTTALDTTVQAQILELFSAIKARGTGLLFISHDLAVVSRIADDLLVMQGGRVVEAGPVDQVLGDPRTEYTRALLRAVPTGVPRHTPLSARSPAAPTPEGGGAGGAVLEVRGVSKTFAGRGGMPSRVAVDDVSLVLERGRTLGLVGESGSGKTTVARIALALERPDAGTVLLAGEPWVPALERDRRPRRHRIGAIYQDPLSSFDPRLTVGAILADAAGSTDAVAGLLASVDLSEAVAAARPLQLSGGQRQRVAIARALAPDPEVLVCDEPVSALDVSIQAQVLDLLDRLQRERGLSLLLISHDLGVIQHMSDTIAVMRDGRVLESGSTADVFAAPAHPYTRELLAAAPRLPRRPRGFSPGT
ncbi:dipeptide ABC transporter ATP-binding protein [Herbiconiux liangxiaofengii]|uniref:dipeptide ABC transporter ATP-binding protein n=1 Tax=Herbiconiux liangxiaofengii TaxID=3342795 RepID=UPI0035BADD55